MDDASARAEALIALAWSGPRLVSGTGEFDDWKTCAHALVVRTAYLFESVLALRARPLDADILARCLFDHVITFAWLAANPTEHLRQWIAADLRKRLAFARHAESLGLPGGHDQEKAHFERLRAGVASLPTAEQMARSADAHWFGVFGALFQGTSSLEGMYAVSFRGNSSSVHPTALALMPFVEDLEGNRVGIGRPVREAGPPLDACSAAMTKLLLIAFETLGWPDPHKVHDVWQTLPAAADKATT